MGKSLTSPTRARVAPSYYERVMNGQHTTEQHPGPAAEAAVEAAPLASAPVRYRRGWIGSVLGASAVSVPIEEPLFPSYFLGGFECSTHRTRGGVRLDILA